MMIRLADNVLANSKRYIRSASRAAATENTEETPAPSGNGAGNMEEVDATMAPESEIGRDDSARQGKTEADGSGSNESFRFPHFDVVLCPPDHQYLDNKEQQVRNSLITGSSLSLASIKLKKLS